MTWDIPWFENIKKKACKYLLQRYLGQFLKEKLTLDRLSVDLYNGTGNVADVRLDVQALNELGEQQNWPLEFLDGYVENISVYVPVRSLLTESSFVKVNGLNITVQPKQRDEDATSMFESMWSCMTSSMQLAQECLQQEEGIDNIRPPPEGLELFANTIDSILSRVKVHFTDLVIRCEHVPKDSSSGVALEIRIKNLEYLDEAGGDPTNLETTDLTSTDHSKAYVVSSFTTKKLFFDGVTFHTDEFSSKSRTMSRSMSQSPVNTDTKNSSPNLNTSRDSDNEQYYMTASELPSENLQESPNAETTSNKKHNDSQDCIPIIFAKLNGQQEIRIRLKQSEAISGPKVEIDMILGSLITFLTPRQLHALVELGSGLTSPDSENTSNVGNNSRCVQKEMTKSDYKRVEADLQAQLQPLAHLQGTGLQNLPGWSTASIGEDSDDDDFETNTPFGGMGDMSESVLSTASSIESIVSNVSSQTASSRSSRHASAQARRKGDSDPIEDIWHLGLRISSVAVVLLHEDLLTPSADADDHPLAPSSVRHTAHKAQTFFEDLKAFVLTSHSNRDFEAATPVFDSACSSNHLRLFAAPIQLECTQQTSSHTVAMIGHCTTARFELTECLMADSENITNRSNTSINNSNDIQRIELLCFNTKSPQCGLSNKANISLTFKQSQKTVRYFQGKKRSTKTKLRFHLDCCRSEFDITLIDRINALLNPNPLFCRPGNEPLSQKTPPYGTSTDNNYLEYKFDTEVVSPECIVKLRFPIPDLRPIHDMQRCPWWKRNVRSDYMTLKMENTFLSFSCHSRQPANRVELLMSALGVSYTFKDSTSPINIGRASTNQNTLFGEQNKKISLVIHIYPRKLLNGEFDESSGADSEPLSMFEGFQPSKTPTPFSSRRVVHESDTSHAKHQDADSDREELVIPGNKQELQEFTDYAIRSSRIQVDLYFPEVSVQLCSKHIFETIYNRVSTDLLLWEPSAPRAYTGGYDGLYSGNVLSESIHPAFSMCKSGIQYDSEESGESDDEYYPYSVYESRRSKLRPQNYGNLPGQSTISIMVTVGQGLLQMFTPVRDSLGNVIPGRQGEFLISLCDTSIFSVSGFRGNLDLGYVCVQAKSGILYHCGLIETPSGCPPLKEVGSIPGKNLLQTIYPTNPESKFPNSNSTSHSMLTVAIRIQANHETHHMKVIRIACAVNDATLRVNISRSEHTWLTQLQDMFDVLDYPIAGYNPSPVLTELHMHVWSSCIDYRPLHLPIRALITIGSFSISSNLVAQTRTNTLRIITEDCAVLLSNQCQSINVKLSDYVCVMDSGLFELSLRYSDKPRGNNPQMDLRAYNNMIHIRTCADSGRALTQVIEYLAMDGDLPVSDGVSATDLRQQTNVASSNESSTNTLLNVEPVQQICDLSKSQHERVIEGISEAMEENISLSAKDESDEQMPTGVKLFFFPDEDAPQSKIESTPLPQVASELGDTTTICVPLPAPTLPPKRSDTDDEYDIIEKEVEIEGLLKSEKSVIWHVIDQAPRWIKNFDAVPVGRSDLLNAPKTFPTPITRYTLCEMNVIWHMYGGHDFKINNITDKKRENHKTVNFVSDKKSDSSFDLPGNTAMYIKNDPEKIKFSTQKKKISIIDWKKQGGIDRNHDILIEFQLNKVRFRHEVYPEKTKEASRQMLLISELEIRDRLATSQINKFLYQYTTEARPKRAQTNMVIVKQLFVRPDPQLQREESILRVSVLPLRLNIDQDALLFLISFFSEMSGGNDSDTEKDVFTTNTSAQNTSKHNTPTHQPPIMTVATQQNEETTSLEDSLAVAEDAQKLISDNLLILLEDDLLAKTEDTALKQSSEITEIRPPVYFRDIRFDSEVPIRIDYHGKRVDMSGPGGALAGLLMGIGQLNCSEIKLRRFRYRHGILGFEKLVSYALHEWLTDIKKNQLPSLLGGVGPMYALVQLFQGIRDLFWLPIEQYQKDGRIVHGLQRGANSFTTSTAMAAIELTTRIIHLIQTTAETAYDMVSPGPSVKRRGHGKKGKKRYNQPQDFREGVSNAYTIVKDGLEETAYTLVRVASHEHEQKGYSGAVGGILRQIPPTVVKPIILATEATNNVLGGMVCELVPEVRREILQKWRSDDS